MRIAPLARLVPRRRCILTRDHYLAVGPNDSALTASWAQYSLLQTVVEACQKKRLCQFQTSPRTFGNDPCPGVRKWVEVAYKCRPCKYSAHLHLSSVGGGR